MARPGGGDLPSVWPEVIVVDSKPLSDRFGSASSVLARARRRRVHGLQPQSEPWVALPSPYMNTHAWERFFAHMPGQPRVVVGDMDTSIRAAVATSGRARASTSANTTCTNVSRTPGRCPTPTSSAPGCCSGFYFVNDWEAFVSVVQHEDGHETQLPLAARFIRTNSRRVRDQLLHREPGDPRSNDAAEAMTAAFGRAGGSNRSTVPRASSTRWRAARGAWA